MANIAPNTDLRVEISNRQILRIALPISLALLVPQLNFVANTYFLGGLGETELGTAGITGVFYLVFALVGNGLNSGLQALIARRAGENRPLEIGKMFAQAIWIALLFAAIAIIIAYLIAPAFFAAFLTIPQVQAEATGFVKIRIWGLPFLYLFQICNAMLIGTNNSRYLKYGFIIEALLNIFLDYALINGRFGFPALGFDGAAVASVIAEFTGLLIVLSIIFYKKFHERFFLFTNWKFNKPLAKLVFNQSLPLVLQYVISVGAWLLFYILIENSGTGDKKERPLAISNAMRTVFAIFGVFTWAFANTSNAMVSNIIGQGKKDKVIFLINKIAKLSFLFAGSLCVVANLFPEALLGLFSDDKSFIEEAIPVLRIVTLGITLMSVAVVWLNAVTGTANTRVNLAIEIITIILYTVYIYLVLNIWELSLVWAWASELLYWISLFTLSYLYLKSGRWKKKEI
jgi:multidrug resistance protein, MATE family